MALIGVQRWSLNRRKRLCEALSFIVHCCTKPSGISRQWIHFIDAFGYIRPYDLNNIDIRALCWTQEDINHRIGKKAFAYPGLKTTLSANAWLSICGSSWSLMMWSVYLCAVRPPWYQLSPVFSHCWHIPCGVCHCEGDLRLHWAWRHVDARRHILPSVESRCALKWLELSFPFYWGQ